MKHNIKTKFNLSYVENGVGWFESEDQKKTLDIPVHFTFGDREFDITKDSECYFCYTEEYGYHFCSKENNKILIIFMNRTELGFEYENGQIYNIVQKH